MRRKEIQESMKKRSYVDDLASKKMCDDYHSIHNTTSAYHTIFDSGLSHCDTSSHCDPG